MIHLVDNINDSVWSEVCTIIGRYKLDQISFYIKEFVSSSSSILILGCPTDIQKEITEKFENLTFLNFFNSEELEESLKDKQKYELIIIPFLAMMSVVDHREQEKILKILKNHILPSGKLVFDIETPDMQVMLCDPSTIFFEEQINIPEKPDSIMLHTQRDFEEYTQILHLKVFAEFLDSSGVVTCKIMHQIKSRYTFKWEMYNLLLLCGFDVIDIYGDHSKGDFTEESPNMVWVSSF